jgi:hypothetical protein
MLNVIFPEPNVVAYESLKFDVVINNNKTIPFGQAGASDFTKHKNQDRKINILIDTRKMKIGMTLQLLVFIHGG